VVGSASSTERIALQLRRQVRVRATKTIRSEAVRAGGCDMHRRTSSAFFSGVRTQWNSHGWRFDEFGASIARSSAALMASSGTRTSGLNTRMLRRDLTSSSNARAGAVAWSVVVGCSA
jgi:hypothetical protein